ncbi:MAG: PAS domain-containing sensor histidine kinase [Propionibacteriales bacterium]|nr:PAS domain-containing sensor histidine kinase [Propionibacteriales bacterium]
MSDADDADVLDALPDGVIIADSTGAVTHANARALRLLEFQATPPQGSQLRDVMALQDLEGRDWLTCVNPYHGIAARRDLLETAWRTMTGREILVTGRLHRDRPGGTVLRVALALRDARARQVVDRDRSDLVATVAHELRSPLTGVKGFTSTLLAKWERFTESQKLFMLRTVDADADRLTRLIAELLDVARIDSGRLTVRKEPLDVAEAVTRQVEPLSATNGRAIVVHADAHPRIWVDKDKFSQIVANLVENAVRHGDGDVWVSVDRSPDGGAELIVDDAGSGIDETIRPRMFTKFWKHGQRGGSGLGLYIVGGLVHAHDGTVHVESSPAGGARMRVVLPAGQPPTVG